MEILSTTAITVSGIAKQVFDYCQAINPVLAVGDGIPWLYPEVPPPVDIYLEELPSTVGYFPIKRIVPVVLETPGTIAVTTGETWGIVPLNLLALKEANCKHVLIEADIIHNSFPPSIVKYHSVGVYLNCLSAAEPNFSLTKPNGGFLDIVQQLGNLPKVANATHVIQIIREI